MQKDNSNLKAYFFVVEKSPVKMATACSIFNGNSIYQICSNISLLLYIKWYIVRIQLIKNKSHFHFSHLISLSLSMFFSSHCIVHNGLSGIS